MTPRDELISTGILVPRIDAPPLTRYRGTLTVSVLRLDEFGKAVAARDTSHEYREGSAPCTPPPVPRSKHRSTHDFTRPFGISRAYR